MRRNGNADNGALMHVSTIDYAHILSEEMPIHSKDLKIINRRVH